MARRRYGSCGPCSTASPTRHAQQQHRTRSGMMCCLRRSGRRSARSQCGRSTTAWRTTRGSGIRRFGARW
ncbi:hypothetical protein CGCF415_v015767 [Colletotrichum fructicola]|nr:hypothetical protein CGCF415_v015767 [Colletotrichum fructicola]